MGDDAGMRRSDNGPGRLAAYSEIVYGAAVTLLGAVIVVAVPYATDDVSPLLTLDTVALRPSFYPLVVGALITLTGVWMLVRSVVKTVVQRRAAAAATAEETTGEATTIGTPLLLISLALYVLVVNTVGFRSATILYGTVIARWLGAPWWAALLIGVVPAFTLFALFVLWLGVPLPADIY